MKKICFFLVTYAGIAIKLYQVSIHVHTCPSVATDDREHFQFLNTDCWYPFLKNNLGYDIVPHVTTAVFPESSSSVS